MMRKLLLVREKALCASSFLRQFIQLFLMRLQVSPGMKNMRQISTFYLITYLQLLECLEFRSLRYAFVIKGIAISFHVIKPDILCPAITGLGENQDRSTYSCIRLEHPARHRYHGM